MPDTETPIREMKMNATTCELKALDTPALAEMLGCSVRHIATMDADGKLPSPIRLGKLKRWVASDIDMWMRSGAPDRSDWNAIKAKLS